MRILSHRSHWQEPAEKRAAEAFGRSFPASSGTAIYVRDLDRVLVIAHDPPSQSVVTADDVLALHAAIDPTLRPALNDNTAKVSMRS
jgi:hypothetical protein